MPEVTELLREAAGPIPPLDVDEIRHRVAHRRLRRRRGRQFLAGALGLTVVVGASMTIAAVRAPDRRDISTGPAVGRISQFDVEEPGDVTVGPDGTAWVATGRAIGNGSGGTVVHLAADGSVLAQVDTPVPAHELTFGFGSIWAAGRSEGEGPVGIIARIDPASAAVVATIAPARPGGWLDIDVAVGTDAVWVSDSQSVLRIDPDTNRVIDETPLAPELTDIAVTGDIVWAVVSQAEPPAIIRYDIGASPREIYQPGISGHQVVPSSSGGVFVTSWADDEVVRYDSLGERLVSLELADAVLASDGVGGVWAAEAGTLVHLDREGTEIARVAIPEGRPSGIAASSDGSVWVTLSDDDLVVRYDPASTPPSPGERSLRTYLIPDAVDVAVSPDGYVWLAGAGAAASQDDGLGLARLDPDSGEVQAVPAPSSSFEVVSGFGSIWSLGGADSAVPEGNITRIDPLTRRVIAVIGYETGGPWSPTGIAIGPDAVWVADQERGAVLRIDPASNEVSVIASIDSGPTRIAAVGAHVYVTTLDQEIVQVDPREGGVETIGTGSEVAPGADGRLWVSDPEANQVTLLDPDDEAPVATVDDRSGRLESDRHGGVWVAGDGWVEHFDANGDPVPGSRVATSGVSGLGASVDGTVWLAASDTGEVLWWGAPADGSETVTPPPQVTLLSNGIDVRDGKDHEFVSHFAPIDEAIAVLSAVLGPVDETIPLGICGVGGEAVRWGPVVVDFAAETLLAWRVADLDGEPDPGITVGLGVWPGMPAIDAEPNLAGVSMHTGSDGRVESLAAGCGL